MGIAQAAGADPANGGRVALVDAALDASLALLHDNGDVVPGLQELVELRRTGRPDPDQFRASLWTCPTRLRPAARAPAPPGLDHAATTGARGRRRLPAAHVCDRGGRHRGRLEGEAETGSLDIQDRNACARLLTGEADVVVVTGVGGVVGVHRLVRTLAALAAHGVDSQRLLPVVARAPRITAPAGRGLTHRRALLGELAPGTATVSPLMVPFRRDLESVLVDGSPLPRAFCTPLGAAVAVVLERTGDRTAAGHDREPVPVRPGSLGLGGTT